MWKRLSLPLLRARFILVLFSLPMLLVGCNLNQAPVSNVQAVTGAPVVRIVAPQPNAIYREGVSVPIQAQISNAGADIDRVEVVIDGSVVQTFPTPNTAGALTFSIPFSWTATGAGPHSIDVVAYRADGTSSASASATAVSVSVVADTALQTQVIQPSATGSGASTQGGQTQQQVQVSPTTASVTNTPAPPTQPPPTATSSRPQVTTRQGINVRSGPSTAFNPPIGSLAANTTVDLLARNPGGDWYKIRYYNGEGWVFGNLVDVSGDITSLPIEQGPPLPTPAPVIPTAVPPTAVPATTANLVAGNIRLDPAGDPVCNQTFNIFIDVANLGTQATTTSGSISVRSVRVSDGSQQATTVGGFGIIQPGQTLAIGPIPLTVSTFYAEQHRLVVVINPDGVVPETGNGDNTREFTFTLQKGSCP